MDYCEYITGSWYFTMIGQQRELKSRRDVQKSHSALAHENGIREPSEAKKKIFEPQ